MRESHSTRHAPTGRSCWVVPTIWCEPSASISLRTFQIRYKLVLPLSQNKERDQQKVPQQSCRNVFVTNTQQPNNEVRACFEDSSECADTIQCTQIRAIQRRNLRGANRAALRHPTCTLLVHRQFMFLSPTVPTVTPENTVTRHHTDTVVRD